MEVLMIKFKQQYFKENTMTVYKFANGATLIYQQNKQDSTTQATIGFSCGSKCDGDHPGLSHFLEHMLVSDTDKMTREEAQRQLDIMDTYQNAFTTKDCIALTFNCPSVNFVPSLKINSDFLFRKHFDNKLMHDEISPIIEEMHMRKDDEILSNVFNVLTGDINSNYIIGTKDNITSEYLLGTEESLRKITQQDFFDYMDKYFISENFICSIVSSLPFEEVKKLVERYFINHLVSKKENKVLPSDMTYTYTNKDIMVFSNTEYTNLKNAFDITFFFKNDVISDFDNKKYSTFENWLFNNQTGKFTRLFREKHGLTYTSYFNTINLNGLHIKCLNIQTSPDKVHTAIKTTVEMLDDIISNGVTNDDLAQFYMKMVSQRERRTNSLPTAEKLFFKQLYSSSQKESRSMFNELLNLNKDDLNNYFKHTYGMSNVGIILSGNFDKAQHLKTDKELQEITDGILNSPLVVPDEEIDRMIQEACDKYSNEIQILPTLNEILAGFKLGNKMIAEMEKKLIVNPELVAFDGTRKRRIKKRNITFSKKAQSYLNKLDKQFVDNQVQEEIEMQ